MSLCRGAVSCTVPGCPCSRLSASGPVLRCCVAEKVSGHKIAFKAERSAPCLRSPSATSVPLVRDPCSPGTIRSQAEGGMSLSSKSHTGQREEGEKTHTHPQHGAHARFRKHSRQENRKKYFIYLTIMMSNH